jgi:hypothetical protein
MGAFLVGCTSMRNIIIALVIAASLGSGSTARAYLLVEDIPNLTRSITSQIQNYAQYILTAERELTQITNQVTQIENQVIQLARFGNPQYYINLLNLNQFLASASVMSSGVGNTIAQYRQLANGSLALSYTGNGLYSNLQGTLDRFGNPVQYNTSAFAKFAAVNNMVESYNTQQRTYNQQMASLQQQLTTALQNLNTAPDLVSRVTYSAQINAIHAQINALNANSTLTGQAATVQQVANQNDAARVQEANRQQEIQERQTDLQSEAHGFSNLISGGVQP